MELERLIFIVGAYSQGCPANLLSIICNQLLIRRAALYGLYVSSFLFAALRIVYRAQYGFGRGGVPG